MVSVPRLSEAGLGVTSQWRDSSEASLKPGAVPDPERWKHLSWDWEGAIRIWAQLPASPPDIKAHLFSFASASIFQRATNSTFSLLLRPAVCCSPFWWFYFVYSAGKTGESQVCLETAGNVQLHSAIAPPPGKLWSEIRRNQTLCGKARGKRKNAVWLPMIWGTESISCFDMQKQKKGIKKSLPSKECLFAVGLYFFLTGDLWLEFLCSVRPNSRTLWKPISWSWYEQGFRWGLTLCCFIQSSVAAIMLEISIALHSTAHAQAKQSINSCSVCCISISKAFYVKKLNISSCLQVNM